MLNTPILITLAAISGVAITLQGQFMSVMDATLGTKESVFITYGSGALVATILMFTLRRGNSEAWSQVPWYAYTAGLLGLIVVATIGITVSNLGNAKAFTLIVASQFLLAALIDHFGLFTAEVRPVDPTRLTGLGVMLVGVWMVVKQ